MTEDTTPLPSVLVVDDTIENLRLLATMLSEHGYEVRPVTNGRQALQAVEHDPPDLILLDINMPEMNGYEVCRRLKADPRSKDVPIIFLTAMTDTLDKVQAFDTGGIDYITKPFQFAEVLARVKTHIALRRAQVALSESYQRLRELEQLRDDLVHMVVHDMRSPLMVMMANLGLIQKGPGQKFTGHDAEDLQSAIDAADVLNRMTVDLLEVRRLEEGKMPVQRSMCNLTEVADGVRARMAAVDRRRSIELANGPAVPVDCDAALVRRIIENLVANGINHTPPGSRLRIAVTRVETIARVTVDDEGPGVPADARDHIFNKFGTIERGQPRRHHSAGLGLAFCKLAVEMHGGRIGVEPRQPVGSSFWFELPL